MISITRVSLSTRARLAITLALLIAAASLTAMPLFAAPPTQTQEGEAEITRIDPTIGTFSAQQQITVDFEVEDQRPRSASGGLTYLASIVIEDSDRNVLYSSRDEGEDRIFTLFPRDSRAVTFRWTAPPNAEDGIFYVFGSLHDEDQQEIFDIWEPSEVEDDNDIAIAPDEIDLGSIDPGEVTTRSVSVLNEGLGLLEWRVTDWPDDWLELIEPTPDETVLGRGRIRVQVGENLPFGESSGRIRVESNGGTVFVPVRVTLRGSPDGEVTEVDIQGSNRLSQGELLRVDVTIENTADIEMDYRSTLLVELSGRDIYDSNAAGEDKRVTVDSGDETEVTFEWNIPTFADRGDYTVTAELRAWNDFGCKIYPILDCGEFQEPDPASVVAANDTFEIEQSPPRTHIEPTMYGFGVIDLGETPEAAFQVTNSGRGSMEWEVASVPDWLELIEPKSPIVGDGEIVVRISESAPGGRFAGEIEVVSTGGNESIPVSVSIDAPTPTRTPSPTPTQSPTPSPTATPRPASPTATPQPIALPPAVFNGEITVRNGAIPENPRLVARLNGYESPPALIEGDHYSNLVVAPIGEEYYGLPVEFYLAGIKATNPIRPIFLIPNTTRSVDLIFDASGELVPTVTPVPPTPTATTVLPTPTTNPSPTVTATPTVTLTPSATPTITVTPTRDIVVEVITPTPFSPLPGEDANGGPPPSTGACNVTSVGASAWSGAANMLFIIAPLGMIAGYRRLRR